MHFQIITQMRFNHLIAACLISIVLSISVNAQQPCTIKINAGKSIAKVQPTMWGIFFEDINMGADGGIYAELVMNRSFEFSNPLTGWTVQPKERTSPFQKQFAEGTVRVLNRQEANKANPRFVRITADHATKGSLGLTNEGFHGMGIKKDLQYNFSLLYRQATPGIKMYVELVDSTGKSIGNTLATPAETGTDWHKQSVNFIASSTESKAKLNIWFEGSGTIDLDFISLFPADTWKTRPGGMRSDLVQLLADLKPGFIRFPGGCIVEGYDLAERYQWKKTIGPVEDRQLIINRWNFEFPHRPTPDYFQTFGLGFYEYFQLAEDIGAEPLPILNCGMACQFNSAEVVALNELDPYVQDALDLIEFANGDASTKWGKVRAQMGHPAPFHLKIMGVGNENWGPQYLERLAIFTRAIKTKYPEIRIVNSSGTDPAGERFDLLNNTLRKNNADIIDEHYYRNPEWFFDNARRYDHYPRNGSKVFVGEYAAQSVKSVSPLNKNNWLTALSEAAFMTGLERNAGVVCMASYAPLFANADAWQWTPDLIWVNNLGCYGTPNYYVQKLYSLNRGTRVLPVTLHNECIAGQDSLYATACIDSVTNEIIIKLVNSSGRRRDNSIFLEGVGKTAKQASLTILQSDDLTAVNSFDAPENIAPKRSLIPVNNKEISLSSAPYSFNVIRVKL